MAHASSVRSCFFGYLAGASPRIAYLGFQAALTFLFCFVYDDLQSIDLEPLRARFVALSMGVVIASLITHHLWPVRQVNAVCESLARNFSACAQCWLAIVQKNWDGLIVAQERFNRSLVEAAQLTSAIEYEGGEGRVRFGYASRFLAHEFALFEQLHLLGREQSRPRQTHLSQGERLSNHFSILCQRLGGPHEGFPKPSLGELHADDASSGEGLPTLKSTADDRMVEIERILVSLERLTAVSA